MTRGNMSRRFGWLSAIAIAILLPASALFSQENLPNTLQQLQETLKRLQDEVKALQNTVQRLTKEAKNHRGAAVTAAGPGIAAAASQGDWRDAQDAYKHGRQLEEQRQYRPAIEAYSRAVQIDPKSDTAFLHRGYCLFQLGENSGAIADFTQSLALQPNSSRAYLARALALAASGQDAKALADASQALQRDPQYLDAYLLRGRLYESQGNRDLAAADFTKAVSVAPQSEKAYLGRAGILESAGQPEQALNDCQNAVRVNPNSAAGYLCRAESYLKMKLAERAVEDVNRAVLTAQTFNQPLPFGSSLAQALEESASAQVPAATPVPAAMVQPVASTRAPALPAPSLPAPTPQASSLQNMVTSMAAASPATPRVNLSQPLANGSRSAAIAVRMQRPAPSAAQQADAQPYVRQGRELIQKEQFHEALNPLDRAIDTDPWSAPAFNLRGYAHLRLLQFEQAVADCSEAIRLQPAFMNAYENRASARRHLGDHAGAQEDAHKVSDLLAGPPKPPAANSSLSATR
jgi:tetratricopeptide (TPR) repeat protein